MPKKLSKKQIFINTPPRPELDLKNLEHIKNRPTGDTSLLSWVRWYIAQEILGTGKSQHTEIAAFQELQKFVNYFYRQFPSGNYTDWTRQITQAFIDELRNAKYSLSSIRRTLSYVKAFASYLSSIGMVNYESHPTRGIKPIKPAKDEDDNIESLRIVTQGGQVIEEGQSVYERMKAAAIALISAPKTKPSALPYRDLAILTTLYYTGLRAHELCSLRIDQMKHSKQGGIWFMKIKRKGDPNFTGKVYLKSDGVPYIEDYLRKERDVIARSRPYTEKYIFLRYTGKQMTRQDIWLIIKSIANAALTPEMIAKGYQIDAHPHSLRHEITYKLLREGLTESETAQHLGHKSTRYISRYSKRSRETIASRVENVPV